MPTAVATAQATAHPKRIVGRCRTTSRRYPVSSTTKAAEPKGAKNSAEKAQAMPMDAA